MVNAVNMKYTPGVLVLALALVRLSASALCMNETSHQFKRMEYHNGFFYTSGGHCLCRFNMSFQKEECVGETGQIITKYDSLLLIDKENDTLIACGTGINVTCQVRELHTLKLIVNLTKSQNDDIMTSTAVGSGNAVIAFISWGTSGGKKETVLYTATRNTMDHTLSPLSVRRLRGQNILQLYNQIGTGSRIELVDNDIDTFSGYFDPRGGFAYDGMAYFVANQITDSKNYTKQSKLIRLCQDDTGTDQWLTYKDIAITCQESNFVLRSILLPVGHNFRGSFEKNDTHLMAALFIGRQNNSVCLFSFDSIRSAFDNGSVVGVNDARRYLKPVPSTCQVPSTTGSCNQDLGCRNSILSGKIPGNQVVTFGNEVVPKMASGTILGGMFTVILITQIDTNITVYYLNGTSPPSLVRFREIHVGFLPPVMTIVDDEVYLLENSKVMKKSLNDSTQCDTYVSAYTCITQQDPFCGWCRGKASCITLRECGEKDSWLPITTSPSLLGISSIDSIAPTRGPMSGGTSVTLTGTNLDLYETVEIIIGNKSCVPSPGGARNMTSLNCETQSWQPPDVLNVSYTLPDDAGTVTNLTFEYLEDPTVSGISPNRSFASGGRTLTVVGSNFDIIQNPRLQIVGENISEGCDHTTNKSIITCTAPEATEDLKKKLEAEQDKGVGETKGNCGSVDILCVDVEFQMDGVNTSLLRQTLELTRDPVFFNFTEEGMVKQYSTDDRSIVIKGDRINISARAADYDVTVGGQICDVLQSKLFRYEFHCLPPAKQPASLKDDSQYPEVWVRLGYIKRHVGFLQYLPPEEEHYVYLYVLVGVLCLIVSVLIVVGILLRRRSRLAVKKLQNDMQSMEMKIQTEFRQGFDLATTVVFSKGNVSPHKICKPPIKLAFADLQTDMTDITGELVETGLPYHKFPVYAFQILFPADDVTDMTLHKIFNYPETPQDVTDLDTAMMKLDELFQNKFFVLSVIDTLEKEKKLSLSEKSSLASCLSTLLVHDLNLFSQLVKGLLKQYVTDVVLKKKHKSLFRRCQSITENMSEMWLGICLHEHLAEGRGGSALIMLVKAIQTVMTKSPIDAITDAARATLSYEQLLLCHVDNDDQIRLQVMINDGAYQCSCTVLACDSIGQVKAKCLGVMYKKDPASKRPTKDEVELQWHCGKQGRLILQEEDTKPSDDNCVKMMTLADYHVTDGALMELLNKEVTDEEEDYANVQFTAASQSDVNVLIEEEPKEQNDEKEKENYEKIECHLVKQDEENVEKNKILPEVHLNRLLQAKLNVKQYVDEALDSALDRKDIPAVVKFIFSLLDELAASLGVDNDTLLSWKNNCYPIRFWGKLIQKPGIVFDADVPGYLQPSLDVVATTFRDSFGPAHSLSKNSAPHKLLFYKDQEDYRLWVKSFHRAVSNTPPLDERELATHMDKLVNNQKFTVNRTSVLYEIYKVLVKYKTDIVDGLEEDKDASRLNLPEKLEHVFEVMDNS